ncbi:MAG: hypothetical protein L3J14_01265 [Flavobacteriaceae bacterium]|nr:hypothetical protein [Flavobacteriaceae bacterium]
MKQFKCSRIPNKINMMSKKMKYFQVVLLTVFTIIIMSCNSLKTASYDQYSYQKTTEIKVDASNLIDKATTSYVDNIEAIESLNLEIQKIVAYEKNKPNNEITYAMWKILSDSERNLLVGFLKYWKENDTLSQLFVTEAKTQIMEAMDLLIKYEGKKDKVSKDKLMGIINGN